MMTNKKYTDGIHQISNAEYHASEGVSRSALWKLKRSPAHYYHEYLNPNFVKPEPTANMILGSLVHTLVLEPELFKDEYIIKPELQNLPIALKLKDVGRELFDKNKAEREAISVANEMELEEFNERCQGKTIITTDQYNQAIAMKDSVFANETAVHLIYDAKVEQSIYWTHESTGLPVKVRPDAWLGSIVTDLKTCQDASFKSFQSEAMRFGYFLQAGMIHQGLKSIGINMEKFVFMCVEKTEPYLTATYILDDEALDYGVNMFDNLMIKLKECRNSDRWPAYPMQTLTVPAYAKYYDEV